MSMRTRLGLGTMVLALFLMSLAVAQAEVITFDHNGNQTGFELVQHSAQGVELKFRLKQVRLEETTVDGTVYQQVSIPGVFLPVQAGAPNLPSLGRMVALPGGGIAHLTVIGTKREIIRGIDVLPAAPIPWDTDDSPAVYSPDPAIYGRDAYWPEQIVQLSEREKMRGVDAVILGVSPFQYNPVRKELIVFSEIHLRLDFEGGNGQFGQDRLRSKDWDSILKHHLLNFDTLPALESVETDSIAPEGEYQYVIITPDDPVYIEQAERLQQFRMEQGISTGIVTLSETGSTADEIENWIDHAYLYWQTPPEAVLMLGDWTADGGTDGVTCPKYNDYCVSDNIYADYDGDHLPDIVFARMTATPENVEHLVDKAINYELNPPVSPGFYDNPLLACGWQQDRWFCLCSEIVHGFLDNVLQKTPVREYVGGEAVTDEWSSNQNTWMLIDYFGPDGLGYIPLTPDYLTDWTGDADGINDAINSGAFITQHRDHGGLTGWGHPAYYIASIEVFTEAFHRMEHGALGVVAASQISYSFTNDTLVFGIWDYMWPNFDPGHGASGPIDPRPAFGLASAKYFLRDSVWPYNVGSKVVTYHLFHAHGDAYTTLYTEMPQGLVVESDELLPVGAEVFNVRADAGAMVALSMDGRILGVAEATGDWQEIPILPALESGEARLTVTKPNHYRYSAPIPVIYECTFSIAPVSVPILQQTAVQVTVWDDGGQLAPDMIVSIDGWGIDERLGRGRSERARTLRGGPDRTRPGGRQDLLLFLGRSTRRRRIRLRQHRDHRCRTRSGRRRDAGHALRGRADREQFGDRFHAVCPRVWRGRERRLRRRQYGRALRDSHRRGLGRSPHRQARLQPLRPTGGGGVGVRDDERHGSQHGERASGGGTRPDLCRRRDSRPGFALRPDDHRRERVVRLCRKLPGRSLGRLPFDSVRIRRSASGHRRQRRRQCDRFHHAVQPR
jgi:hypothetical protein